MTAWTAGVDALGWTLVHFVWQGALAGAATALALGLLRHARPQWRYLAACLGLLTCVLWPAVTLVVRLQGGDGTAAAPAALSVGGPALPAGALHGHLGWIVAAWGCCSAAMLGRTALGVLWIARASREGARHPRWQAQLDHLAQAMGVARQVRLRIVHHLASPVTAGCWRPVVLVPASLLSGMPPELLHALLAHEVAHIRRHDYLVNLLQNLAEILLFYHPAVWWISRRIRIERELIADDLAAGHAGGARQLAQALSELEKLQFAHPEPALAAHGGDLMNRIVRLLHPAVPGAPRPVPALLSTLLPVLALAGACMAGLAQADAIVAKPTQRAIVDFSSCSKPVWPQAALAAQETGTVTLAFLIDAEGRVADANVQKSSGHPALDEAAREGIRKCRFKPARLKHQPVKSWMKMQYVWTLE